MHPLLVPIFIYLCIYLSIYHSCISCCLQPLEYKFQKKLSKNCEGYRWYAAGSLALKRVLSH